MTIPEQSPLTVEEGVEFWIQRYGVDPSFGAIPRMYLAMVDLDDIEQGSALPVGKAVLAAGGSDRRRGYGATASAFADPRFRGITVTNRGIRPLFQ